MKTAVIAASLALLTLVGPAFAADAVDGADVVPPPIPPLNAQLATPLQYAMDNNRTAVIVMVVLAVALVAAMLFWASHIRRRGKHRSTSDYPGTAPRDRNNDPKNTGPITTPVP
ncbi:MAG: hypothetical protein LUC93_06675 [Planctomycetaceae bacterium]|nr:hypothetical protein [Planctomycetaceae bacterium]